eukprot:sb/3470010/
MALPAAGSQLLRRLIPPSATPLGGKVMSCGLGGKPPPAATATPSCGGGGSSCGATAPQYGGYLKKKGFVDVDRWYVAREGDSNLYCYKDQHQFPRKKSFLFKGFLKYTSLINESKLCCCMALPTAGSQLLRRLIPPSSATLGGKVMSCSMGGKPPPAATATPSCGGGGSSCGATAPQYGGYLKKKGFVDVDRWYVAREGDSNLYCYKDQHQVRTI